MEFKNLFSDGGFAIRGQIWVCIWEVSNSACLQEGLVGGKDAVKSQDWTIQTRDQESDLEPHRRWRGRSEFGESSSDLSMRFGDPDPGSWTALSRDISEAAHFMYLCTTGCHEKWS